MSSFAGIFSSGVCVRGKESGSLVQYHGLRSVESKQMAKAIIRPSGSISSPGGFSPFLHFQSCLDVTLGLHLFFFVFFLGGFHDVLYICFI